VPADYEDRLPLPRFRGICPQKQNLMSVHAIGDSSNVTMRSYRKAETGRRQCKNTLACRYIRITLFTWLQLYVVSLSR